MTDGSAKKQPAALSETEIDDMRKKITRLEKDLAEQKSNGAKLYALLEASSDLLFINDTEGRYHEVATSSKDKLYRPANQLLGKTIREIFPMAQADRFLEHIQRVINTGKTEIIEYNLPIDGTERWFECRTSPLIEKDKPAELSVSIVHDITERIKMEAELFKNKNLESIGVLAGGIAHDFNNLLAIILGNISVVQLAPGLSRKIHERIEKAENAIVQAKELTGQLLTFSKGGVPVYKTLYSEKIIKTITGHALSDSRVKCLYLFNEDLWPVHADETQLSVAIRHIITNAVEAMPGGGLIKIKGQNADTSDIGALPLELNKYVKITIEDEGPGISEENLKSIFFPYFTTKTPGKDKGKGLGLAITYSIIKKHGGYIEVRSKPGTGTVFDIYLPAAEPVSPAEEEEIVPVVSAPREKKILLMDDEHFLREITKEMIKALGYKCESAADGEDTIKRYKEAIEKKEPFDVVILDLTNKKGMGGKETAIKLRQLDPGVNTVISSGYCFDDALENFQDYGFKAVLSKPFTMNELKQVLES